MSAENSAFIRGFGDLASGSGGIAWSIAGGGAVTLEGGKASPAAVDALDPDSDERWSFFAPLDDDQLQGSAVFRHITVESAKGMIVCTSIGQQGIPGHGNERTTARLRVDGEDVPYEEALISTQYEGAGDPTRFGLELWPPDADQQTRAAATRVSGSLLGGARSGGTWAGLFRCHTDGTEGLGSYLLWRA